MGSSNATNPTPPFQQDTTVTIGDRVYSDLGDPNCAHDDYATDTIKGTWVEATCENCPAVWQEDGSDRLADIADEFRSQA